MESLPALADQVPVTQRPAAEWFAEEVQPHEARLRSYLHGRFPAVHDVDDVVQESYLRIWRARTARPIRSAKAFLFTIARHLALDVVRRKISGPDITMGDLAALCVSEDKPNAADTLCYHEKVCLLAEVLTALPARCREIVVLRKLKSLSQKDVAARLGLSERTVENQLARGLKRCEKLLRRRGLHNAFLQ
jgi:RNA polymerase sigma factor (sigma-70 family)